VLDARQDSAEDPGQREHEDGNEDPDEEEEHHGLLGQRQLRVRAARRSRLAQPLAPRHYTRRNPLGLLLRHGALLPCARAWTAGAARQPARSDHGRRARSHAQRKNPNIARVSAARARTLAGGDLTLHSSAPGRRRGSGEAAAAVRGRAGLPLLHKWKPPPRSGTGRVLHLLMSLPLSRA
jgi:hypothetical protein